MSVRGPSGDDPFGNHSKNMNGETALPGAAGLADGPVQIVTTDADNHSFELMDEELSSVLLRPDLCDKKVCVVSVAGAFRKGKSFLLNFFLRYFQSISKGSESIIGAEHEHLRGFSWRGGSERETSGILLWKYPFEITLPSGEEIVVILMDTQGAFDSQSTVKDCATVFALSTMLSSLQIYNLSQNIQEDDLQHLQLFTEYGRLALEDTNAKPFQSLLFLVRDWSFPYEAEYGFDGGARILDRRLQISDRQHSELQQLRKHIRSCFSDIKCFLMPHPGLRVATSHEFSGKLSEIESEFKHQLRALLPRLFSPENLVVKEINGSKVTCRELLEYFRVYIKIFQGEELPEPKSMLIATAEANNLAAVANAKAHYCREMEEICGGETPYMSPVELDAVHLRHYDDAVRLFKETRKMGGEEFSQTFLDKLDEDLREAFENFVKVNNGKNLFRSARTPTVFFLVLVIFYLLQQFFTLIYLETIAAAFGVLIGFVIVILSLWAYARYSGHMREIGQTIDEVANMLWENAINPLSQLAIQEGVRQATGLTTGGQPARNSRDGSRLSVHNSGPKQRPGTAVSPSAGVRRRN